MLSSLVLPLVPDLRISNPSITTSDAPPMRVIALTPLRRTVPSRIGAWPRDESPIKSIIRQQGKQNQVGMPTLLHR